MASSKLTSIKKGVRVRILRKESYWYNQIGTITSVDIGPKNTDQGEPIQYRYPVLVRFDNVNYIGTNSANFDIEELVKA